MIKIFKVAILVLLVTCICFVAFVIMIRPESPPLIFPDGKKFGFSIFDDTDGATLEKIKPVYDYLNELGIKTTKSIWPLPQDSSTNFMNSADTLDNILFVQFLKDIQQKGFEIAYHGARGVSSLRTQQINGLDTFHDLFGKYPNIHVNHSDNRDNLYWGKNRFNNLIFSIIYDLAMPMNKGRYLGHIPGTDYFWGDIAQKRVTYVRNFVYKDINTYKINPSMPYHDPAKPYVKYWFSSSAASGVQSFNTLLSKKNIDKLEAEGGVCIVYTHFAYHFINENGQLNFVTKERLKDLASRNGYFVPVSQMLDFMRSQNEKEDELTWTENLYIQIRWIFNKVI